MRKTLIAGLAVALLLLGLTLFYPRNRDAVSSSASSNAAPGERSNLPRVAADSDWSDFDEDDLEHFINQLEAARSDSSSTRNEFSVIVADGETIITDGYEIGEGRFVFTYFTPEIVEGESGPLIRVSTQRIELDINGENGEMAIPDMTYRPGQRGGITSSFKSDSGEVTEGWSIDILADLVPGGILIEGSTGY